MKSLAVIGTGIAGMGAAHFLNDRYEITLYEKNSYPGGHTNTLTIDEDGVPVYIDSAFMVYNEITYPNLTRLFKDLDVETKPTDMSFSVQHRPSGLEYCGTGMKGLFAQRKNLFSLRFWKMLLDMNRFNKESLEVLEDQRYLHHTISSYVQEKQYGEDFLMKFLVPMSSAVWSMPTRRMMEFPISTLVRFFKNHGFLGLRGHYQWRTIVNGSRQYREKILKKLNVRLNVKVKKITRENGRVHVFDQTGEERSFDKVVLACHADEALNVLSDATSLEKNLLSKFGYQMNKVILHTDQSVMPKTRGAWSSWNYRIDSDAHGECKASTIYDMNSLQQVSKKKNYFVSVNDPNLVGPNEILWQSQYTHPVFNVEAIAAQDDLPCLNKNSTTYFCGSYFKYGFHEDALTSGIEVVRAMTGEYPVGYKGFDL
ncbi:MAG: FAD-dependent oxidoreductase [Candidatus Omnitrophica bacterium]|nr:FAD-dependent oxidoreductase [Candidatus Omnitrophota bacterium]